MTQRIITINVKNPAAKELRKRKTRGGKMKVLVAAAVVSILIVAVTMLISGKGQEVGEVDAAESCEVQTGERLKYVELLSFEPEAESVATTETGWDTPLSENEMAALLEVCEQCRIAPALALGLIEVESSFRADVVNPAYGCYGYCQLNPHYFPNGLSPEDNIRVGIGYLGYQLERYGELEAALTAYNAGHDTGNRVYAQKVLAAMERWEKG